MITRVTPSIQNMLWENKILFTSNLSGKQLGRERRPDVNGNAPGSKTNNSTEYLLLV